MYSCLALQCIAVDVLTQVLNAEVNVYVWVVGAPVGSRGVGERTNRIKQQQQQQQQ